MKGPQSRRITIGRLTLNLDDWGGEGQPVLLLHGMGANTHWWDFVAPRLEGPRLLALDMRGHGESSWTGDGAGYRMEDYAADLDGVRRSLGWERFFLAGHSLGARVALHYAASRPDRLFGVAALDFLAERPPRVGRRHEAKSGRRQPYYVTAEEMESRFHLQPPGTSLAPEQLRSLARRCLRRSPDGRWTWKFDWNALAVDYAPVWPDLAGIKVPALVLRGEHSTVMSKEHLKRVAQGLPAARAGEVAGAHHHLTLDAPEETARLLREFLGRTAPRAASSA